MRNQSTHSSDEFKVWQAAMPYTRFGYNDVVAGLAFRREYEVWNKISQMNYERCRLYAQAIIAAGLVPPVWNNGIVKPRGFDEAVRMAFRKLKCDDITEMQIQPEQPDLWFKVDLDKIPVTPKRRKFITQQMEI